MSFSISKRILILVVVPALCLVGMAGWLLAERWATAQQMRRVALGGEVIRAVAELVTSLQSERGRSALFLGSKGAAHGQDVGAQRKDTDAKLQALQALEKGNALVELSAEANRQMREATGALARLEKLRSSVSGQSIAAIDSNKEYAELVEELLDVSLAIVRDADHAEIKNYALALSFLQATGERAGLERGIGAAALSAGRFSGEQLYRIATTNAEQREFLKLFLVFAPSEMRQDYEQLSKRADIAEADRLRDSILKLNPGDTLAGIDGGHWFRVVSVRVDGLRGIQDALLKRVIEQSEGVRSAAMTQVFATGAAIGAVIVLVLGFGVVTMRSIVRPVRAMTDAMGRLASGDLDCEVPARERKDEIGDMAKAVQVFKDNAVRVRALEAEQKEAEARAAAQRKAELQKLADDFQGAIGGIIGTVSSAATELEAAASTLTKTAETTQQLSTTVASASEQASGNVQSVASATEELASSVSEISRQVQETAHIAREAVRQAEKTDVRIAELSQAAAHIGNVVRLITGVAEQTNLLALNATIEAARAGEAGRGFAVVAQEVKALAAQTAKATDEISSQIASMQTATQDSVAAIKEISGTITRISEIAATVAAAVEEQGAATQDIARNVQQASQGTAQVAVNITDVNRGATETGSASVQVLSSAQSLSSDGNRLKLEVDKFLATVRAA